MSPYANQNGYYQKGKKLQVWGKANTYTLLVGM